MNIVVIFTGICALVTRDADREIVALLPNGREAAHDHGHGGGGHVMPHIPYVEFDEAFTNIKPSEVELLTRLEDAVRYRVFELPVGCELYITDELGKPIAQSKLDSFSRTGIVEMEKVAPKGVIEPTLVQDFDPVRTRVAARMTLALGDVERVKQSPPVHEFRPVPPGVDRYNGAFAQEVAWRLPELTGTKFGLGVREFGNNDKPKNLLEFDGTVSEDVVIYVGNATFEDILKTKVSRREIVDNHFDLYYGILAERPQYCPLPHRVSEVDRDIRTGGGNCPPAIIPGS